MDVRDYEYIVTIADQGSITRAAEQLFITQPALTKFLQRIEKELGLTLFTRKGKQFLLTEAGQKYVDVGHQILRLDRKLTLQLQRDTQNRQKHIRMGFPMGRTQDMLGNILPRLRTAFPDIRVTALADTSRRQFEALKRNELDLALLTNVEQLPEFTYIPVETSYLALAVRGDDALVESAVEAEGYPFPVVEPQHLKDIPFITLLGHTNSGHLTTELFQKYALNASIALELSDVRSALEAVEQGLGISMFMSVPAGSYGIRYLCVKGVEPISQTVYLVYRTDMALSPPLEVLIKLLLGQS